MLPTPLRLLALLCLLPLAACEQVANYRLDATGPEGTILVVTDTATWSGPAGEALRATLAAPIRTLPAPEPAFTLRRQGLSQQFLNQIRQQKNVVFLAPYTDTTAVARFLRARLDSSTVEAVRAGAPGVFPREDLWAAGQLVVYATADSDTALARSIRAVGPDLRARFDRLTRERTTEEMFAKGRRFGDEDSLMRRHHFAINVQHDYFFAQDTTFTSVRGTPAGFVRLRRIPGETWRDLFVYYEDGAPVSLLDPDTTLAIQARLMERFLRGEHDDAYLAVEDRAPDIRPIVSDTVTVADRFAIETRGTWRMVGDAMGGPFVSYALYDENTRRYYLYSGLVFAPRFEKREFLRQMEVIGHTFRTREDERAVAVTADRSEPGS